MSLKKRWESTDSKLCGVETEFSKDVSSLLSFNIDNGGFNFVVDPLMNPSYRPCLVDENSLDTQHHPFNGSDLAVLPPEWRFSITGKISSWIDLDSENEMERMESEIALKQEIAWAKHLSLQSCFRPTSNGTSCTNYARCVNQILQGLKEMEKYFWEIWNSFRLLCDHNSKLSVALDIQSILPSSNAVDRWFGESVKAAILSTECFIPMFPQRSTNLLASHEELITRFFHHYVQVIISGKPNENTDDMEMNPHKSYLDYLCDLFCKMEPLSELIDLLDTPLQPLKDNLNAHSYEMIEGDSVKYTEYQRAIAKALEEMASEEKASELTTVLMKVSLQAAEETGQKLKVYAVEKNPYALHDLVKMKGWEATVTIICKDMRVWNAPERADILVSELLGYFGDNELSPECLDGAQRFLKPNGISIPSLYSSFIQPITTLTLYIAIKTHRKASNHAAVYLEPFSAFFEVYILHRSSDTQALAAMKICRSRHKARSSSNLGGRQYSGSDSSSNLEQSSYGSESGSPGSGSPGSGSRGSGSPDSGSPGSSSPGSGSPGSGSPGSGSSRSGSPESGSSFGSDDSSCDAVTCACVLIQFLVAQYFCEGRVAAQNTMVNIETTLYDNPPAILLSRFSTGWNSCVEHASLLETIDFSVVKGFIELAAYRAGLLLESVYDHSTQDLLTSEAELLFAFWEAAGLTVGRYMLEQYHYEAHLEMVDFATDFFTTKIRTSLNSFFNKS